MATDSEVERIARFIREHAHCQPAQKHLHRSCGDVVAEGIENRDFERSAAEFLFDLTEPLLEEVNPSALGTPLD